MFFSFWLTALCTTASRSIHITAHRGFWERVVSGSQMWQFAGSRETTQICFVLSVCIWLTNLVLWNVLPGSFCFIIPTSDSSVSWSFPWWPFSYFFSWFVPCSDPLYRNHELYLQTGLCNTLLNIIFLFKYFLYVYYFPN